MTGPDLGTLGHVVYTHGKTDDARILMEVSRLHLGRGGRFEGVRIVHAFNGAPRFAWAPGLEDELVVRANRGHFRGAVDLINAGLAALEARPGVRWALVTASDTWPLDRGFLEGLVDRMRSGARVLAASAWARHEEEPIFRAGMSLDFFLLDLDWNREARLFPLDYEGYVERFQDLHFSLGAEQILPERSLAYAWLKHWSRTHPDNDLSAAAHGRLLRIVEREPIHAPDWTRRQAWPELGLHAMETVRAKRDVLAGFARGGGPLGEHGRRLLEATDLSYYNVGPPP